MRKCYLGHSVPVIPLLCQGESLCQAKNCVLFFSFSQDSLVRTTNKISYLYKSPVTGHFPVEWLYPLALHELNSGNTVPCFSGVLYANTVYFQTGVTEM